MSTQTTPLFPMETSIYTLIYNRYNTNHNNKYTRLHGVETPTPFKTIIQGNKQIPSFPMETSISYEKYKNIQENKTNKTKITKHVQISHIRAIVRRLKNLIVNIQIIKKNIINSFKTSKISNLKVDYTPEMRNFHLNLSLINKYKNTY